QSWCVRAPWAMFGLAPLCLLAGAYFVACVYLWFGWKIFLPGADTPFVSPTGPIYGIANMYFQAGKFYYFSVPVLVGWAIGLIAAAHDSCANRIRVRAPFRVKLRHYRTAVRVLCVFTVLCDNLSPNRRKLNAEARLHCLTLPSRSQSFRICGTEEICQEATGNR